MELLQEIKDFISSPQRFDVKSQAIKTILKLTGSTEGIQLIIANPDLIAAIVQATQDEVTTVVKDAISCLVNISAHDDGAVAVLNDKEIVKMALHNVLNQNCYAADNWCKILNNLTRPVILVENILDEILLNEGQFEKLVTCFTRAKYNTKDCNLDYLGHIFSNLCQSSQGRKLICNKSQHILQRLLTFTHHENSDIRRRGAISLVKNVCFDTAMHEWLLGPKVDILPYILLPLAGPEEYDDDDNDKFPTELQYLGPEKTRESDGSLRIKLLESLAQLCATRSGREYLRAKGTYEILRELHKWEVKGGNKLELVACENVVDVLIRTEEEIGNDNLKEMEIPDDVIEKIKTLTDD